MAFPIVSAATSAGTDCSGTAGHEHVLLGMHFLHQNTDCNVRRRDPVDIAPSLWDYIRYMPEDLEHMSYADFWHWWYEFERYKGDEKGLAEFDRVVDECLARGLKVKVDLAWSTWWTNDKDWQEYSNLAIGPVDVDDWIHLCDLLARRYKGKVALWLLQGEANDLKNYWQGAPIEHVHEVYRAGCRAFKRVDQDVMISIAGASPSVPREELDEWVKVNAAVCKGLFDDVPMNYFADTADPYKGLLSYYRSIRGILDALGEREVEIGSGESSFQWAETSYDLPKDPPKSMKDFDPEKTPLCELKQAWRCNESLGTFFTEGGTKFMFWGTEYAPGGGWPWRWGLRKYQDWWGLWRETHKIPGTNIVYRYDNPDGRKVDLRPGWTSRETDPYHPIWQVYKFWAQATPPGAEAVRIDFEADGGGARILRLAAYLRARDRCVALIQNDEICRPRLRLAVGRAGWPNKTPVTIRFRNESIDYATGAVVTRAAKTLRAEVKAGIIDITLPAVSGFTTLDVERYNPEMAAEPVGRILPHRAEVGRPIDCTLVLRNTGRAVWTSGNVSLRLDARARGRLTWRLGSDVRPGEQAVFAVRLPAPETVGRAQYFLRLCDGGGRAFGPTFCVATEVFDPDAPRKLVALREFGHIRLKWFAPERADGVREYELQRSTGFAQPFVPIATVRETTYVDSEVQPDKAYYYRVVAITRRGAKSRPSNEDNAKAASRRRIWDAEIVSHDVPAQMALGDRQTVTVTIRNTGTKTWRLDDAGGAQVRLCSTALWGECDEQRLPTIPLDPDGKKTVATGESVTVRIPYAAIKKGRFENHWVMALDVPGRQRAYFGSPLLAETVVVDGGEVR